MIGTKRVRHIRVVPEDADTPTTSISWELVRYDWMCPRCATRCGKWDDFCFFCSWDRAIVPWKCEHCDHLNPTGATECQLCGRRRRPGYRA
jgi:hypothetical protein